MLSLLLHQLPIEVFHSSPSLKIFAYLYGSRQQLLADAITIQYLTAQPFYQIYDRDVSGWHIFTLPCLICHMYVQMCKFVPELRPKGHSLESGNIGDTMVFSSHYIMLMKWNYSIVFDCIVEQGICDELPLVWKIRGRLLKNFKQNFQWWMVWWLSMKVTWKTWYEIIASLSCYRG